MEKVFRIQPKCMQPVLRLIKWIFTGVVLLCIVGYLFYNSIFAVVLLSPYLYFYVKEQKCRYEASQKRTLNSQFKDAMLAVSFSLNAGYSMENSFKAAVNEMIHLHGSQSAIVKEFKSMASRIQNNENIEDLLSEFATRSEVEDILYFAEVFRYAKRSGGDIIAIIRNTVSTIRRKLEVESEIQTIISGRKMEQQVMQIMPFAMIAYLRMTSPEFITPLYGNFAGAAIMTVCLLVYAVAAAMSKKIVKIEV